ncbi:MAG: hypothetical protein IJ699_04820, partial [Bacteroidaceae bacterium]|nr:hypothetical protein [Bacteroidaceae bacterium]
MKKLFIILAAGLLLTSCASKKKYNELQNNYAALQDQQRQTLDDLQAAKVTLAYNRATIKSLEDRLKEAKSNNEQLKASYAALQGSLDKSLQQSAEGNISISKLVDEINASNKFIKQLVEAKDKSDSLNITLTNN